MKQKIVFLIFLVCFLTICGYFFYDEYKNYHHSLTQEQISSQTVARELSQFGSESLAPLSGETHIFYTPYRGLLDEMVSQIESATDQILVEVYIFTERDLRDALIRAHERGVDVQILLENNPYKSPYLNDDHYSDFENAGIDVRWSDPLNYSLNHSKLLIIDDTAYISTGNFSYSLFTKNRDLLISLTDSEVVQALRDTFFYDYMGMAQTSYHPNLVVSPGFSRDKLQHLITQSHTSIDFYFPYIDDEEFAQTFFDAASRGVQIRGIVDASFYEEHPDEITQFQEHNISLTPLRKHTLHAKSMLIDGRILYVGSINFSRYSFDENREIGILISNPEIISKFEKIFSSDL